MLDHGAARLALRGLLLTLSVATTGSQSLASSATGGDGGASAFTRAAGSFLTDGLRVGMEVVSTGFATNNTTTTVKHLTATVCTVTATLTDEVAAAARALAVGVPATQVYENVPEDPDTTAPFVAEQYVPGPVRSTTVGTFAKLESTPLYVVRIAVPQKSGQAASDAYVNALLSHFYPGRAVTAGSDTIAVRGDPAPFAGQLLPLDGAWVAQTVSIPVRTYATNAA